MKHLKSLALLATIFTGFATHSSAQTFLELVDSNSLTPVENITPGSSFSLNVEVVGLTTGLDSFDATVSGSTTSITAFASGINLTGFSNLVSGFFGGPGGVSNPQYYGAIADSTSDDITTPAPTSLITANFTTSTGLAPGTYSVNFPPTGSFQELYDANGDTIMYTPVDATINVVPEPRVISVLLVGLVALAGFRLVRPMLRRG